jgi:hypothetical protein
VNIMAISSISPTTTPPAAPSAATTAPAAAAPEASTQDPSTRVTLSNLSEQAGIVATLGQSDSGFQTYDATGLLNAVAQAAMATPTSTDPAASTDMSAGSSASVAAAVPGDWGAILKSNPALTSVAVEDAVAQGIVNTINVYV